MSTTLLQPTDEQIAAISENFHVGNRDTGMGYAFAWLDFARAVLAAQPAPVPKPEPVAIVRTVGHKGASVDWFAGLGEECSVGDLLYASPPAPVPVPLTDEQIDSMWREPMSADWEHREFARAIEAHHGIVASPEVP
jgi:hypothetical protein